jgi:DNA repair protein SbcC/Rad50
MLRQAQHERNRSMIPLRLELRNFLSYGDGHPPLQLDGIRVACLSGPNGNGKSALLDAMVWALWGVPRGGARGGDDLVRHGARDAEVSLEFELHDVRYRVTRTRTLRGKAGTTDLQLESYDGEEWRSLTGGTLPETQRAIDGMLRMGHDTFVHASFIQQGKADAFMSITPQARKQVLGDILDLGHYDRLAEAAREAGRACRAEHQRIEGLVRGIDEELAKREAYVALRETAERTERETTALREQLDAERTDRIKEIERLAAVQREAAEKRQLLQQAEERVRVAERQLQDLAQRIKEAQAIGARCSEIERAHDEFQRLDSEERALAALFDDWHAVSDELHAAEAAIEREGSRITADLEALRQRIGSIEHDLATVDGAAPELEKVRVRVAELEEMAAALPSLQAQVEAANESLVALRQDGARLKSETEQVKQRIDLLGQNDRCPLCSQLLGVEGLAAAQARLREELVSAERRLAEARESYTRQAEAVKTAQDGVQQLQAQLAERPAAERALGEIEARLARAEAERTELADMRDTEREVQSLLEEENFAHEARARTTDLRARLDALGYDPAHHRTVREERDALGSAPSERADLAAALTTLETAADLQVDLETRRDAAAVDIEGLASACTHLDAEAESLPAARAALEQKEAELQEAATRARTATRELGEARQMVTWLDQQEREREGLLSQRASMRADTSAYDQLTEAFGKNGIQEMIVDAALPEIEESANELLARLTDGRMRVTLDTQRAGKGGATISTLDVNVSDELGTRPYELFSGGEKFRVDFAIRIALSRLLARRAGAPLQMLAIDEGFGSQDRAGCDRLIAAIKTIEPDFERILVITHLDEIKDAFPVRIEVEKTDAGSTFAFA